MSMDSVTELCVPGLDHGVRVMNNYDMGLWVYVEGVKEGELLPSASHRRLAKRANAAARRMRKRKPPTPRMPNMRARRTTEMFPCDEPDKTDWTEYRWSLMN